MSNGGRGDRRGYAVFEWINRNIKALSVLMVVAAIVLGIVGPLVASDEQPEFNPSGEIYDTAELVEDRFAFDSPIRGAQFIVEVPGVPPNPNAADHDVLTAAALSEFKANSDALRAADAATDGHLVTVFNNDLGVEIDGIFSIADAVDDALGGGLADATDLDVKLALDELLADGAPTAGLRFTLSRLATRDPGPVGDRTIQVWRSPAFLAEVRYDNDSFEERTEVEDFEGVVLLEAEEWLREVQTDLRGDQQEISVLGIAIDGALVNEEQGATTAPYIFMAVAIIVLLVGALLRSYWAAILTAIGLSVVMMSYNGINSLIGLKVESGLIVFVVPIALISFGVDFFIHGAGRVREMQVEGYSRERAYPLGETALFLALFLAAASSVGAFLSNAVSGIEAITQFGIAAAVSISLSYLVLGWVAPRQLLAVENALGPRPDDGRLHVLRKLGFVGAAVLSGIVVTMTIVMPTIGAPAFLVVLVGLLLGVPYLLTKRRNRKAAAAGEPLTEEIKGAGHGFRAAGDVVHFLARWRVITLPVVGVLAILGFWAYFQVDSAFDIKDFFSSKTDFVKSIDKVETHFGSSTAAPAYVYAEGDLTDPQALVAMEAVIVEMDGADLAGSIDLVRDFNGDLEVPLNAASLVRLVMAVPEARDAVGGLADDDGDGLPDSAEQVAALYDYVVREGVPGPGGVLLLRPDQAQQALYVGGVVQGTRVEVIVPSITDEDNVIEVRRLLDRQRDRIGAAFDRFGLETDLLSVSGGAITSQAGLASFTNAMVTSLPLAILITVLLALVAMRSVRYALITIIPILLVVAWLYGFMYVFDYKINVITATIAAIAIGVGIDYAMHFTVRFRQEFEGEPSRFPALRRTGEGTGGALALSALTSMTGFAVMATAPMPMFATFGVLTAVMIFFALTVSLMVLPSLLLLVTPSRKGEEREQLEQAITGGEFEYRQHERETAYLDRQDEVSGSGDPEQDTEG